jgi:hypothetical protein
MKRAIFARLVNHLPERIRRNLLRISLLIPVMLLGNPSMIDAISLDARKIAMGGTLLPYYSESYVLNPAYLKVQEDSPLTIPIPIGLLLFLGDLPSFDPNSEDFDIIEVANLAFDPPFYLELRNRNEDHSAEIFLDVAEDYVMLDLDNLKQYMPSGPVESGLFDIRGPRGGYKIKDIYLSASPFILMEGSFAYSENMERVLREAEPVQGNTDYSVEAQGTANIGMAINASYVFELQEHLSLGEEPRVLAGVNGKYIMGFVYGDINNHSNMHTSDPIFDVDNPPEATSNTLYDYAIPESGDIGPKGHGIGFDAGLLLRFHSLDIGFGIQDLYTNLSWRVNRERFVYQDSTNEMINDVIFEDRKIRAKIPRTFSLSLAYRNMADNGWGHSPEPGDYLLATNMQIIHGDISMHIGGETYYGPGPIALRMGLYNQDDKIQFSFGAGIPLKYFNFDIAFATHNSTFDQYRGLTMATSISFP